jgi:hypothetical protein
MWFTNPDSKCMKNGKCSKCFPKKIKSQTIFDDNGLFIIEEKNNVENLLLKMGTTVMLFHTT